MPAALKARRPNPKSSYFEIPVQDMTAGLDLRKAATLVDADRARVLRNFSLREPGALTVVPGWRSHSTASLGSGRPQGGQRIYLGSAAPFTLAAWNGGVYKPNDAGVWGSAVSTGWATDTELFFPYDRDLVAILDGTTAAKKSTNGTDWTGLGIAAPSVAPTAAAAGGGSLIDAHTYEFSYSGVDDELLAESNESVRVTQAVSGGNLTVDLTIAHHTDAQVDKLNYYARDVTVGETVRRKVGQIVNPAVTQVVSIASNTWASGDEAPSDHDLPPLLSFGVAWKNRFWARHATVKNRLHFTQVYEPQSWPATYYMDIPLERGDDIAATLPVGDALIVFGLIKIYVVTGQTSLDFEVRPAGASQGGAFGPRAVDAAEGGAVHVCSEGVFLFDGATDRLLSDAIDNYTPTAVGWRKYVSAASAGDLAKTPICYNAATKEVAIGVTNLYPFGVPGEWVLDLHRTRQVTSAFATQVPAWTTTDRPAGGYIRWDGNEPTQGDRGRLFTWSQTIGKLFEERTGTTADGSDLTATYTGPTFALGGRVARIIDGAVEVEPHSGTFGLELLVDNVSFGSQTVDIAGSPGAEYGSAIYGTSTYGGTGRKRVPLMFPLEAEGLTCAITGTYVGQEAFRWYTYTLGVNPEAMGRGF